MAYLDLHRVFTGNGGYLDALKVPGPDDAALRAARGKTRQVLRAAFRNWEQHVTRVELFHGEMAKALGAKPELPEPKFRLQGSFAYHTVNDCQRTPPQQIDQDDGMFLPIGFLTRKGRTEPTIASKAYFKLVEDALRPLCTREGWHLNPGRPKDTCVRVEITSRTHIDIPLYAIRDDAFRRLTETAIAKALPGQVAADEAIELFDRVYAGLAESEIMLAHREEGWIESDPRKLEQWFDTAIEAFGSQVRRLSRTYKGMRDAAWPKSELRSICIMAALVRALENLGPQDQDRDDLALLNTAREMVHVFGAPIQNPVFPGDASKYLCEGWSAEFRQQVQQIFQRAADALESAINRTLNRDLALNHITSVFGPRVPENPELIRVIGAASVIRAHNPAPQPRPAPVRTKSG